MGFIMKISLRAAVTSTFLHCTGQILPLGCAIGDIDRIKHADMFINGTYYEHCHVSVRVMWNMIEYRVHFDAVFNDDVITSFIPRYVDDGPDIYDYLDPEMVEWLQGGV